MPTIMELCNELLALNENWNSYNAKRIDENNVKEGLRLLEHIIEFNAFAPAIVPTVRGSIQLEWNTPNEELEIEIIGPNHYDVYHKKFNMEQNLVIFDIASLLPLIPTIPV